MRTEDTCDIQELNKNLYSVFVYHCNHSNFANGLCLSLIPTVMKLFLRGRPYSIKLDHTLWYSEPTYNHYWTYPLRAWDGAHVRYSEIWARRKQRAIDSESCHRNDGPLPSRPQLTFPLQKAYSPALSDRRLAACCCTTILVGHMHSGDQLWVRSYTSDSDRRTYANTKYTAARDGLLGRHLQLSTESSIKRFFEGLYAVQLIYAFSIALTKFSIMAFYRRTFNSKVPLMVLTGVVASLLIATVSNLTSLDPTSFIYIYMLTA